MFQIFPKAAKNRSCKKVISLFGGIFNEEGFAVGTGRFVGEVVVMLAALFNKLTKSKNLYQTTIIICEENRIN